MNRIKDLREDADLKQTELADAIGIGQKTLSNYEREETIVDGETLKKIAVFFNVTIDYIMGLTNSPTNEIFTKGLKEEEIQELKRYKDMLIWYRNKKERL